MLYIKTRHFRGAGYGGEEFSSKDTSKENDTIRRAFSKEKVSQSFQDIRIRDLESNVRSKNKVFSVGRSDQEFKERQFLENEK